LRKDPLRFFLDCATYGDIVRLRVGPRTIHFINDPYYIQHVLQTNSRNYRKGFALRRAKSILGNGLLTSEGDFWLGQRRLIQPIFHRKRIAYMARVMTTRTKQHIETWRVLSKTGEAVDIAQEMMQLTLNIIGETMFSTDVSGDAKSIGDALTTVVHFNNQQLRQPLRTLFSRRRRKEFKKALKTLDHIVYGLIEDRRKAGDEHHDLLTMLLAARDEKSDKGMSDREVRDEAMTIFLAGHETTANALTWTWYLLSMHPQVAAKLNNEVDRVLGGRTPTVEDLQNLVYTAMVIKEVMRLYPPAWVIGRESFSADEIAGYPIPAKSTVIFSPYVMHRHPTYWNNPAGFNPERFATENDKRQPHFTYFPFGGGPRLCIGNHFAMMEAQIILAMVVQHYELHLAPYHRVELEPMVTLRPRYGMRMTIMQR
jgi:cytochrome P450